MRSDRSRQWMDAMKCNWILSTAVLLGCVGTAFAQAPATPMTPTTGPVRESVNKLTDNVRGLFGASAKPGDSPEKPPTSPPFNEAPPTSGASNTTAPSTTATNKPATEKPLATRKTDFFIPFRVPKNSSATQLQLYVSSDLGLNWKFYGSEKPTAGQFRFLAAHDGEFWYHLHTVYVGQESKPGPFKPSLKVLVDTTAPRLQGEVAVDPKEERSPRLEGVRSASRGAIAQTRTLRRSRRSVEANRRRPFRQHAATANASAWISNSHADQRHTRREVSHDDCRPVG